MSLRLLFSAAPIVLLAMMMGVGYVAHQHSREAERFLLSLSAHHAPALIQLHDLEILLRRSSTLFSYYQRQPKRANHHSRELSDQLRMLSGAFQGSGADTGLLEGEILELASALDYLVVANFSQASDNPSLSRLQESIAVHISRMRGAARNIDHLGAAPLIRKLGSLLTGIETVVVELEKLGQALQQVIDGLDVLRQTTAEPVAAPTGDSLDPERLEDSLTQLEQYLDTDLRRAGSLLRELRQQAAGTGIDQNLAGMEEALNAFDVDEAKNLMHAIGKQ